MCRRHNMFIALWVGKQSPACRQVRNKDTSGMMTDKMNINGIIAYLKARQDIANHFNGYKHDESTTHSDLQVQL